jgi:hypothetical protein
MKDENQSGSSSAMDLLKLLVLMAGTVGLAALVMKALEKFF